MVDLRAGSTAAEFAAVVATVVALVRTRHPPPADGAVDAAAQQVSSVVSTWGTWLAVRCGLHALPLITIDERFVRPFGRPDPAVRWVPTHAPHVAIGRRRRVEEVVVPPLAVPDLVAGVARIGEDRPHGTGRPAVGVTMRVAGAVGGRRREDGALVEHPSDGAVALPGEPLPEDALHDRSGCRIGLETVERCAETSLLGVGVLTHRDESIPIRRSSTEVPATGASHRLHRVAHATLDASAFSLAQATEERHHEVMGFAVGIDTATHLGHPQFDAVMHEQWESQRELCAREGALRLADHHRIEAAIRPAAIREEPCSLRAPRPRQRPGHADVQILHHDATALMPR